jgi:16S rRNA (guanine966-N2)-methyltransferase
VARKQDGLFEFEIVAGSLKGRVITSPDTGLTRPPLTRLRRAIFDFLNPYLDAADFLDLYSGTGCYLFEAVSRGAAAAVGVEIDPKLAGMINEQSAKLGVGNRLVCLCDDVLAAIAGLSERKKRFDIIMMAPPQYRGLVDKTLTALKDHPLARRGGLIICQHDSSETRKIDFLDFPIEQQRKYGNTTFTVLSAQ